MNCLRCEKPLAKRNRDGIEIDICTNCGGVWLDRGELEKIIESERAHHGVSEQQNWRQYDRGRDGYDPEPAPERQKGYLETLVED